MSNYFRGYLAVDQVGLLNKPCPYSDVCDFESDCGYQQDVEADFGWVLGSKFNDMFLPQIFRNKFDHTYQTLNGHFMHLNASSRKKGSNIRILHF